LAGSTAPNCRGEVRGRAEQPAEQASGRGRGSREALVRSTQEWGGARAKTIKGVAAELEAEEGVQVRGLLGKQVGHDHAVELPINRQLRF
jgi:hypothetical protein